MPTLESSELWMMYHQNRSESSRAQLKAGIVTGHKLQVSVWNWSFFPKVIKAFLPIISAYTDSFRKILWFCSCVLKLHPSLLLLLHNVALIIWKVAHWRRNRQIRKYNSLTVSESGRRCNYFVIFIFKGVNSRNGCKTESSTGLQKINSQLCLVRLDLEVSEKNIWVHVNP